MAASGDFKLRLRANIPPARIAKTLGDAGAELNDWRATWQRILPIIMTGVRQNIASRGGTLGESWPTESKRYQRRKAKQGLGRVDLVVTGKLMADMTTSAGVISLTKRRLVFGTRVSYARAVNFGFEPKGRGAKIRSRPFAGWSAPMKGGVLDAMEQDARAKLEQMSGAMRGSGAA